ncbi:hypothetical protein [Stieleria marina]
MATQPPAQTQTSGKPAAAGAAQTGLPLEQADAIKKEIESLEDERARVSSELDDASEELDRVKRELKAERDKLLKLISQVERFTKWREAELVIANPTHRAVALVSTAGNPTLKCIDVAEDAWAPIAIMSARGGGALWTEHDHVLARRVHASVQPGEFLTVDQDAAVRSLFRKRDFFESPADPDRRYVSFRLASTDAPQFARFCGADAASIKIQRLGESVSSIPLSQIRPGSARLVNEREAKYLEDGEFLDSCLIRMVEALEQATASTISQPPYLAVKVNTSDGGLRGKPNIAFGLLQLIRRKSAGEVDLDRARYLLESEIYEKLSRLSSQDVGIKLVEPESFGQILKEAFLPNSLAAAAIKLLLQVEDEDDLVADLLIDAVEKTNDRLAYSPVTHLLDIEVAPPAEGGAYHLDLRLRDVRNREVLSAIQGDRKFVVDSDLHFPSSGRMASIRLKKTAARPIEFVEEQPPINRGTLWVPTQTDTSAVVLYEGKRSGTAIYRSLFGKHFHYATPDDVHLTFVEQPELVPLPDRVRVAGYNLMRAILPPSGYVAAIGSNDSASITIGENTGLKAGDRMYASRVTGNTPAKAYRVNLAVPLSVTKVAASHAMIRFGDSGLREQFPEDRLEIGDIVYARRSEMPVVAFSPFEYRGPVDQRAAVRMKYKGARRLRLDTYAGDSTKKLHDRLHELLQDWNVPMVSNDQVRTGVRYGTNRDAGSIETHGRYLPPNARVTHHVTGMVKLASESRCEVDFKVSDPSTNQVFSEFSVSLPINDRSR